LVRSQAEASWVTSVSLLANSFTTPHLDDHMNLFIYLWVSIFLIGFGQNWRQMKSLLMQSLVFGEHSLIKRIQRRMAVRAFMDRVSRAD